MELEPRHIHAPELYGDYWFNSEPISIGAFQGNVRLIDFWDYSCLNCIRTRPYLNEWHRKYQEFGLLVIGVHTPEFRFARDPEKIQQAIEREGIKYPVVVDNDAIIWTAYANRSWPSRYLIDKDGYIRFVQHGEGGYQQFERAIQQLLSEAGYRGELPDPTEPLRDTDQLGAVCYRSTGEIYLGYLRGALGNPEGYTPESTLEYIDPGIHLPERFYAHGKWMNEKEFLRYDGGAKEEGSITFQYEAVEVNAVMNSSDGKRAEVILEQDDRPLAKEFFGGDVVQSESGACVVSVHSPRMYNLVKNKEFGSHSLRLKTSSPNLEIYTLTFVSCAIPELISNN